MIIMRSFGLVPIMEEWHWKCYGDRYDDYPLQAELDSYLLLCLPRSLQPCKDETSGTVSESRHCHGKSNTIVLHRLGNTSLVCQSAHGTRPYGCVYRKCSIVPLCSENALQLNSEQRGKEFLPLEHPLHLEARMGQPRSRPAEVAPAGAKPPSPRTVCARRLAEAPQRPCCHYQPFRPPDRAMSYSPPYSPSLFKRPDRR